MPLRPILVALDYHADSTQLFTRIRALGHAIWLDSCHPLTQQGRFDILAAGPERVLETRGDTTRVTGQGESVTRADNPFDLVREYLPAPHSHARPDDPLPFCGGALGYFGYDLARRLETIPACATADLALPDMWLGIYHWALVVDHQLKETYLTALAGTDTTVILAFLSQESTDKNLKSILEKEQISFKINSFKGFIDAETYIDKIDIIQKHIIEGDCYQVNFAQRFSAAYSGDPWQAYRLLREVNPAPFAAYLDLPGQNPALVSLSPERFIACHQNRVLTCPIKGTIGRGQTPGQDQEQREKLANSEKDRAENLMIVDLLRNDLSRVCRQVKTPALFEVQTFANVHHLVSTVTGTLKTGEDNLSLLKATFPGGSITGAPKIRAMELIESLESHRRGPYCGSIGYVSACGTMDTNITIRTLIADTDKLHCWGGGGIVADSEAQAEYEESLTKIRLLMTTLEQAFR